MYFNDRVKQIQSAYENNRQVLERIGKQIQDKQLSEFDPAPKLSLLVLKGPSGIGKSSSVKEFSKDYGFNFVSWDAEIFGERELISQSNLLKANIYECITNINKQNVAGITFLVNNFFSLDAESERVLLQYIAGWFNFSFLVGTQNGLTSRVTFERSPNPPEFFVIGKQTEW
jgi:hypothetical protein